MCSQPSQSKWRSHSTWSRVAKEAMDSFFSSLILTTRVRKRGDEREIEINKANAHIRPSYSHTRGETTWRDWEKPSPPADREERVELREREREREREKEKEGFCQSKCDVLFGSVAAVAAAEPS